MGLVAVCQVSGAHLKTDWLLESFNSARTGTYVLTSPFSPPPSHGVADPQKNHNSCTRYIESLRKWDNGPGADVHSAISFAVCRR